MKIWLRIPYKYRLSLLDFWNGLLRGHLIIQFRLRRHLRDQQSNWQGGYTNGYFYQGLDSLCIKGAKPTEFRFKQYMVNQIINGARVLDNGSNAGFVAIHIATQANEVIGVELNPYLNRIARDAAAYLGVSNVEFVEKVFRDYWCVEPFDVIMSLSNHHTIVGNFYMPFEAYISKISGLLKESGYLLFESHNVFAEGKGGVGDDGDMEEKIVIMSRYFQIERYKMVLCYLEHGVDDLDEMFVVARKSSKPTLETFRLEEARTHYDYSQ